MHLHTTKHTRTHHPKTISIHKTTNHTHTHTTTHQIGRAHLSPHAALPILSTYRHPKCTSIRQNTHAHIIPKPSPYTKQQITHTHTHTHTASQNHLHTQNNK